MTSTTIPALLTETRTIAVVGLSAQTNRPSHEVAAYLQSKGYRIIPVNPTYAGTIILSEHCYPTLTTAAKVLSEEGVTIDIVDCFRRPEHMAAIVQEAIAVRARCVWMQRGIIEPVAAAAAEKGGLYVVMDKCLMIEHKRLS
ncbi:MAG TPA: CoA-binding protein [Noviherbaspirillum sp.]|jgi:hypothetical protein|uniref:CoA-binding protein n=1 Tax=Noviherbaspirillum sp. TaxID=1926288 RepID=UPI002DDC9D2D|nr:CoA-binding protein [Noviherbaspirillum sp.]HEV2612586.1 CoA-binding protein [Noviherbaspirillum sp.]